MWPAVIPSDFHHDISLDQLREFEEARQTNFLTDGVIRIKTSKFNVHRILVAAASDYLFDRFEEVCTSNSRVVL